MINKTFYHGRAKRIVTPSNSNVTVTFTVAHLIHERINPKGEKTKVSYNL